MSFRAWIAFFLPMVIFSFGYVGWWVRCALVPAPIVCQSPEYYWGYDGIKYRLPAGKFIPEAEMLYKYHLIKMEIPHKIIADKPYIPLWLFLKGPEPLDWITSHTSVDAGIYIKKNIDLVTGSKIELNCEDYFGTDSIILYPIQNRNYPSKLLRDIMLAMAFFDTEAEHIESCDWLCGKTRSWRLHKLSHSEYYEYSRIETEWRSALKGYIEGRSQDDPGHFAIFLKNKLGDRSPF